MRRRRRIQGVTLLTALLLIAAAPAAQAGEIAGVSYRTAGAETLKLDAFLPDEAGPHPAVVLIHGGGWTRGSRDSLSGLGRWLAARGMAAFAIDYRLAPAHRYPAAVEDAQAAVRFIRTHARSYGVDPTRLAAFGLSAGGTIAAMVGTLGEGPLDRDARVRVAIAWSAPLDLAQMAGDAHSSAATRLMIEGFVGCGDCAEQLRDASPAAHVDASDAAIVLANSTAEAQPVAGAEGLSRILSQAGVPSLLIRVPGTRHAGAYGGAVLTAGGDSVLEASARYMAIWFDQPRLEAVRPAAAVPGEPIAPGLALLAALVLVVAAAVRFASRNARRGWFDPAAMALIDTLGAAGASADEIEATLRLLAPRGASSPARSA
jgi:acetyl esterase/lipase